MRAKIRVACLLLVLLAACLGGPMATDGSTTLRGRFQWNAGDSGDLEAIFTPTGEGRWDVDFHFEFRGKAHVYSGTAEGSLTDGELRGSVQNEARNRTFTFDGSHEGGRYRGNHWEVTGGGREATGTLTLAG